MSTIAKWNNKVWSVSVNEVKTIEDLSFSWAQKADNNTATEDKKTTNERGTELFSLTFTTILHSNAGINIREEIDTWKELVTKTGYFYLEEKSIGPKLQLRTVLVNGITLDDFGRMRTATLSFTFKEYDEETTSVKSSEALSITATESTKEELKPENNQLKSSNKKVIQVGSRVKPLGSKYYTGEDIPDWVKEKSDIVKEVRGEKTLLKAINSWVYSNEITLI